MKEHTPIGNTIARIISHIAKQATEERAMELLGETALGLRRKFPLSVLRTARFVLDLAIDGESNVLNKAETETKREKKPPAIKSRKTTRKL